MSAPSSTSSSPEDKFGFAGRLARLFLDSKLTPLAVIASILLGALAVVLLPREEEPQIKVPMIDVLVSMPGTSAVEIENRLTKPLEKLLWEIPDVEYLYSTSSPGNAILIVRYRVGIDIEQALVRLNQRIQANLDRLPPGASVPLVKPRTIDDVPILALTLHSRAYDHLTLRRLAAQLLETIKSVPDVAETTLIGGAARAVRVQLDPSALAARTLTATQVILAIQSANRQVRAGSLPFANQEVIVEVGRFFRDLDDLGHVVIGVFDGQPVYLRDVSTLLDDSEEPTQYVMHGEGNPSSGDWEAAVTLSIAKRPGANAIDVVNRVMAQVENVRPTLLPTEVGVTLTRDYGHTAAEKSNELLLHMGIAVFGVTVLILLFLGWRESLIVLLAIPSTLALTLLVFYLYGYTLNRITLFALIFSIGILVDDAIVVVENIVRHLRMPGAAQKSLGQVALAAVDEVGNPTLLATWAVIAAILPMAFVGGLMGPYMRPIPIGSTAAMLFSVAIAFTLTPWAAVHVLRRRNSSPSSTAGSSPHHDDVPRDYFTRAYYWVMGPLLGSTVWRGLFLLGVIVLLLASVGLVGIGAVQVKMLPFDNKSEFQIILNTPEGTTLEATASIAQEMATAIRNEPEIRDLQIYAGTAAPFNFNGLVRHYFTRRGPNVADIQVNLVGKEQRSQQSHDIAKRIRPMVSAIARQHGATVVVAEVPPGPPVLQSIVAEIYGPDEEQRLALARDVRSVMERTRGVVDVDWYVEAPQLVVSYVIDQEKAALHGISQATIVQTLALAAQGLAVDLFHAPTEREDIPLRLELPRSDRSSADALLSLRLRSDVDSNSPLVPLSELVRIETSLGERSLYRKNLRPVTYVTADAAGEVESPAYAMFAIQSELLRFDPRTWGASSESLPIYHLNLPKNDRELALKWDGEWHITLEVFRDLGLAFAVVLILIAMLMVGWFKSYLTPLIVMAAIPFSLIGILPAHWAFGAFFTATSMIGFMAGAGIVVRNSIILVDFIELRRSHGVPLRDAVIEAGAVRFRPMLLTALAVVIGASVILADPIFQGLAISLLFGEIASLLISRMAVPVLYYMVNRKNEVVTS
ncbi:MAG TPA: efflux RND transporter permease subunit [Opitutaceae bacterium]|nr:efflux RND transporter permease subunit [Opitutaceae bacterium]